MGYIINTELSEMPRESDVSESFTSEISTYNTHKICVCYNI